MVDDATQDAFVVAYRRRAEFDARSPRPWLYGIARGIASNYRRSARRAARKRRAIADVSRGPRSSQREPQALLHDLDRFLAELSERDRELFVLSEVEGLTGPELAEALGYNTSTAYGRLRSLRQRLARRSDADEELRSARERRPRATNQGWAALVHAVQRPEVGWLGLSTGGAALVAGGLGATVTATALAGVVMLRGSPSGEEATTRTRSAVSVASVGPEPVPGPGPGPERASPTLVDAPEPPPPALVPSAAPTRRPRSDELPGPGARHAEPEDTAHAPVSDDLARENALVREASTALAAGEPQRALRAMQRHARQFPRSALSDLRTALRVEALCALGQTAQARGEARAHATANPGSPLRERILRACPADSSQGGQDTG